ncbi:hypothetical protein IVA80_07255 [Bradyrhizobium sp. 139]|uniref:hypothetical protein n=1 Tax=Bradyrhizobium sp. 139 TaxID=2782616 RepID=UPI001FF9C77B|nr:hypothetical protein [Bradyrhizobium sp. 139]MCK1740673.1 hypothetical protein [Bradyrhizobium sp. 139]
MRLSDLAKGSSVFLGVIVAGYLSTTYVDQRLATPLKTASAPAPTSDPAPTSSPVPTNTPAPSACVGEDGSWKNWLWPNVPTLSPKCR